MLEIDKVVVGIGVDNGAVGGGRVAGRRIDSAKRDERRLIGILVIREPPKSVGER